MHAATRPPVPGGMDMMNQANGPTSDGMPHRPYMPNPGPMGYNNHPTQPGVGMPHYRLVS